MPINLLNKDVFNIKLGAAEQRGLFMPGNIRQKQPEKIIGCFSAPD
jgi:hypothetical protein